MCDFAYLTAVLHARSFNIPYCPYSRPCQNTRSNLPNTNMRLIKGYNSIYIYSFEVTTTTHKQPDGNHNTRTNTTRAWNVRYQDNAGTITTTSIYNSTCTINTIASNHHITVITNSPGNSTINNNTIHLLALPVILIHIIRSPSLSIHMVTLPIILIPFSPIPTLTLPLIPTPVINTKSHINITIDEFQHN